VEAEGSPSGRLAGGLGAELDRVEAALDAGETDLRRLGFWRVVALIKRDDDLIDRYAEQVGRIDAKAFRARVRFQLPVWIGILGLLVAVAIGVGGMVLAGTRGTHNFTFTYDPFLAGLGLLIAAGAWAAGFHSFTHYVVGRLAGIRFTGFFIAIPPPPLPGLKTDYATYLRVSPVARAWMHASGAIATKLAPFLVLALSLRLDPAGWAVALLWGFGVFQIGSDLVFSTKASDWKKFRRELAVAKAKRRASGEGA
jgi:hypothetical protein